MTTSGGHQLGPMGGPLARRAGIATSAGLEEGWPGFQVRKRGREPGATLETRVAGAWSP